MEGLTAIGVFGNQGRCEDYIVPVIREITVVGDFPDEWAQSEQLRSYTYGLLTKDVHYIPTATQPRNVDTLPCVGQP